MINHYSNKRASNLPHYTAIESIKGAKLVGVPISIITGSSQEQQAFLQSDLEKVLKLVTLQDTPTHFTTSSPNQLYPESPNFFGTRHALAFQFYQEDDGAGVSFKDGAPYMFNRDPRTNEGEMLAKVFPKFLVYTPKKIAVVNSARKKVFLPATKDPICPPAVCAVVDDGIYFPDDINNFQGYPVDSNKPLYIAGVGVFGGYYSPAKLGIEGDLNIIDGMQRGSPRQLESKLLTIFSDNVLGRVAEIEERVGDKVKALVIGPMTDEFALNLREVWDMSAGDSYEFERLLAIASNPHGKSLRDLLHADEQRMLMVGITFLSEKNS